MPCATPSSSSWDAFWKETAHQAPPHLDFRVKHPSPGCPETSVRNWPLGRNTTTSHYSGRNQSFSLSGLRAARGQQLHNCPLNQGVWQEVHSSGRFLPHLLHERESSGWNSWVAVRWSLTLHLYIWLGRRVSSTPQLDRWSPEASWWHIRWDGAGWHLPGARCVTSYTPGSMKTLHL